MAVTDAIHDLHCAPRDLSHSDSRPYGLRRAILYRSCAAPRLERMPAQPDGGAKFATAVDLRTAAEAAVAPSPFAAASRQLNLPLPQFSQQPTSYAMQLLRGTLHAVTEEVVSADYLTLVESSPGSLRSFFLLLRDASSYPVVFHCSAGRDRTGVVSALVLSTVGAELEDILCDYEAAPPHQSADHVSVEQRLLQAGIDLAAHELANTPARGSMFLFLNRLWARHGSTEGFLSERLGLASHDIASIRSHLLARHEA